MIMKELIEFAPYTIPTAVISTIIFIGLIHR